MAKVHDVVAERYELREMIGRGGIGVVYRATDRVLDRPVAVKVLRADRANDRAVVARFEREALAAAVVNHPNIVPIYDAGRDRDTRFLVMEWVAGQTLSQLVRERGPLPPGDAATIGAQVARALAAAHKAGVTHRDIKPANILLDGMGNAKLLDFGIARSDDNTGPTRTADRIGTTHYMAPELALGAPADPRSDIYALGCVLYELLAGSPPFEGDTRAAIVRQHATTPPAPLTHAAAGTPPALGALVLAMLAKDPADRPQTAAELARALTATIEKSTLRVGNHQRRTPTPRHHPRRRRRGSLHLLALVLAMALTIGGTATALAPSDVTHGHVAVHHRHHR